MNGTTSSNNSSNEANRLSTAKKIDKYHYNLHDIIGQGSFATVYLGKDIEKNELRAIKVINTSTIHKDQAVMSSLISEIKIIKSLDNPNIIKCYDVLTTTNNTYLIMDYCEGGDLKSYLKKQKRVSEEKALIILKQILNGYRELYKNGIIHRDLKTENILLKNEIFKLADFGFAKILNNFEKDVLKALVGTPLYMSPQILKHEDYTSKSDIWSIGIIYYEMIYGKTPWISKSDHDLLKKILSETIEFPEGISISEKSKNFIVGCLKIEENERYSWSDIYSHELFNDCFNEKRRRTVYENKMNKIGARLGFIVRNKQIDILKLYQSIDNNKNHRLEIDEFARLLLKIDETLNREQIEYIFNRVDADSNNYIDFDEFKQWLSTEENKSLSMDMMKKNESYYQSFLNIYNILKKKAVNWEKIQSSSSKNRFSQYEFFDFFFAIEPSISELDLNVIFKNLCELDGYVSFDFMKKVFTKEEHLLKYRYSESQSPLMQDNCYSKIGNFNKNSSFDMGASALPMEKCLHHHGPSHFEKVLKASKDKLFVDNIINGDHDQEKRFSKLN